MAPVLGAHRLVPRLGGRPQGLESHRQDETGAGPGSLMGSPIWDWETAPGGKRRGC